MKRVLALATIFSLLLAGCQKSEDMPQINNGDNTLPQTLVASTAEFTPDTKTSLGPFEQDKGYPVLWSTDDAIKVFTGEATAAYTLNGDGGSREGTFIQGETTSIDSGTAFADNKIVALYPNYDAATCAETEETVTISNVTIPATQNYTENSFANGSFPMVAVGTDADALSFKSVGGVLKLQLKAEGEDVTIKSITLSGNNNESLAGTATFTATVGGVSNIVITNDVSKTVTLNCGVSGVTLSSGAATQFLFSLPPVEFTNGFTVTITDNNGKVYTKKTKTTNSVTAGGVTSMPELNLPASEFVLNLSATATANCYIVSAGGTYKIKTVKGNSTTSVGEVERAAVLWESFGTDTPPTAGDLISKVAVSDDKEYITFTVPTPAQDAQFKEGNAVIAAKNKSGTILWSWHIWLTDAPQGQVYASNAGTMMDRNLGATSATASDGVATYGLLYQWGRKDPFLGSGDGTKTKAVSVGTSWPDVESSSLTNGTIDYATKNPMQFIKHNQDSDGDWYYPTPDTDANGDSRWYKKDANRKEVKTIYDPCPPGWKVPGKVGDYSTIWAKAKGSEDYFTMKDAWSSDDELSKKGINFAESANAWYPAAGYLNHSGGSLKYVGSDGCYWSATTNTKSADYAYYAYYLYFYNLGSGGAYPVYNGYRACGHSVRCLQE